MQRGAGASRRRRRSGCNVALGRLPGRPRRTRDVVRPGGGPARRPRRAARRVPATASPRASTRSTRVPGDYRGRAGHDRPRGARRAGRRGRRGGRDRRRRARASRGAAGGRCPRRRRRRRRRPPAAGHGSRFDATSSLNACGEPRACAAPARERGRDRRPRRSATTSRVLDVRNASSARPSASSGSVRSSTGTPSCRRRARGRAPGSRRGDSPTAAGGVHTTPSTTRNTFEPVASQSSPRVLAKIASVAPPALRVGERADVLGVGDRSSGPAVAPPSLRGHGTVTTASASAAGAGPGRRRRSPSVRPSPRSEPSGDGPPVTVIRSRPVSIPFAARTASAAWRAGPPTPGPARPSSPADRRSRVVVAPPGERHPPVDAERLEHAVADEEPVVEAPRRGPGRASTSDPFDPDRRAAHRVVPAPAQAQCRNMQGRTGPTTRRRG